MLHTIKYLSGHSLFIFLLSCFIFTTIGFGQQTGSISGRVVDKSNNEPLVGANVMIVGTTLGAISDLDGYFSIKQVPSGTYQVKFSYISFQGVTVDKVTVSAGRESKLNVMLVPSTIELNQVTVTAEALKNSELSVLNIQKNSNSIVDGISAELISKNNSSDGTDVLKRMTGVTISDGKFAYVRGVSDRYNSTLLNGSSLPSTDPEKKSFSYDLFPAHLIEQLMTSKTATPDKPADFSGGLIEINTIEFPAKRIFHFNAATSYDSRTSFNDFIRYEGGNRDWLGMDDGTRALPSQINSRKVARGNYNEAELQTIGLAFRNNWHTQNSTAPMKGNFKLGLGNSHDFGVGMLGYVASVSYSNQDAIIDLEKNNYTFEGPRYLYHGTDFTNSVAWSAMVNTSLKLGRNHKFSLKNIYNQNADNEITIYEGPYYYFPDYRKVTGLRFISRSLYSSQLIGEHYFNLVHGLKFDWNLNYGNSKRNEPDARRYVYDRDIDDPQADFVLLLDQYLTTRFFGNLDDYNRGGSSNITLKPFANPSLPRFKFGFHYDYKNRKFNARTFGFRNLPGGNFQYEQQMMTQPIERIFAPENFGNKFIEIIEITKAADSYKSDQKVVAGYLMTDFDLLRKIKVIGGVRYEYSQQTLHSFSITNEPIVVQPDYKDWLPSVNITYAATPTMNVRAAFSKTLARPEFRELAPFSYFDFVANELVQGNINLKRSLISNYDLRYEVYPTLGELFAVSGFYKRFKDPIEQVLIAASGFEPIRTYENADKAITYGVEFEVRKKFGFIHPSLKDLSLVGNLSLIHSEINLKGDKAFIADKRPLQGQADFISNVGLYYEDFNGRFSASLIYNKVGERISRVGFANLGDIVELPKDQVDMNVSAKVSKHLSVKLAAKDLLNQDQRFIQRTLEGDKTAEVRRTGRVVSLGLGYQL